MIDKMYALPSSRTQKIVFHPIGKFDVCFRQVYAVKINLDGQVDCPKTRFFTEGYSYTFEMDYSYTLDHVEKIAWVHVSPYMVVVHHYPLNQLDIKNAFHNGDLKKEVYVEKSPGFVAPRGFYQTCSSITQVTLQPETISMELGLESSTQ